MDRELLDRGVLDLCVGQRTRVDRLGHFDEFQHERKPHPGQVHSARIVRELLRDSKLSREQPLVPAANPDLGTAGYQRLVQPIQDPYSVRCAPHVVGVLHDTLDWARRWIEVEINSSNDNPLFDPVSQSIYNRGSFYGGHIGDLLDRQLALVVDEKFNSGLTPQGRRRR